MGATPGSVIIAGGGIGGLTLAIALRRRGVDVRVLERARSLGPAGAGITVQANAMRALEVLGLAAEVAREGAEIRRAAILEPNGRLLGQELSFDGLTAELGQPTIAIHRARLHQVLLDALGEGVLRTGSEVKGYEDTGADVRVQLESGEHIKAELLVGADGLRSVVRQQLLGDGEPKYAGYTSWRGVTPAGTVPLPSRVMETWGRGTRFGVAPLGHDEVYWFAVANSSPGGRDGDVREELLARFGAWHSPVRSLIEATPANRILRTDIADRAPVSTWHAGRVVLLGDAAHPMTPNLGQGGCQAIEDALVLDACLARESDVHSALAAYERRRMARVNRIVRMARRLGAVAQWEQPFVLWMRNALMRATPRALALKQARSLQRFQL